MNEASMNWASKLPQVKCHIIPFHFFEFFNNFNFLLRKLLLQNNFLSLNNMLSQDNSL